MPIAPLEKSPSAFAVAPHSPANNRPATIPSHERKRTATAVIYCEKNFGEIDGKTANGLIRHSETYEILSVIDSKQAGLDTGEVLGGKANAIPI